MLLICFYFQALVVQDPKNRVFVIRNGGFAAYGAEGRYKIIDVIDTLHLGDANAVLGEKGKVLGWKKTVTSISQTSGGSAPIIVATFFNVPANNVVIIQQKEELIALGAGQHVITNPNTTYRGFYSMSQSQYVCH